MGVLAERMGQEGLSLVNDGIVPALIIQLQRPEVVGLSDLDLAIYYTPPGTIYQVRPVAPWRPEIFGLSNLDLPWHSLSLSLSPHLLSLILFACLSSLWWLV